MTTPRSIEIVFPTNAASDDLTILTPARYDRPGRARLGCACIAPVDGVEGVGRLVSSNGGLFIGLALYGPPEPPYNASYWLVEG